MTQGIVGASHRLASTIAAVCSRAICASSDPVVYLLRLARVSKLSVFFPWRSVAKATQLQVGIMLRQKENECPQGFRFSSQLTTTVEP